MTSASASDGSLRRCSIRAMRTDAGASSHSPMNGTDAAAATCSMTCRSSCPRIHRIDDGAVTSSDDQSRALSQRGVDARRHLRRIVLQDQGAPAARRRTGVYESRRCGGRLLQGRHRRKARDPAPASTFLSPTNLRPPRVMDEADAGAVRPSRDIRVPGREAHSAAPHRLKLRCRGARLRAHSRTAGQKQRQQRHAVEICRSPRGNGSTRALAWRGRSRRQRSIRRNARSYRTSVQEISSLNSTPSNSVGRPSSRTMLRKWRSP